MSRVRLTQSLERAANFYPHDIAVIDGDRRMTWREFRDRAARLAGGLRAQGVMAGDRVAVLAQNSAEYLEAFYGVAWAGAVIVPFNTRLAEPELRFQMDDADVKAILFDAEFAATTALLKERAARRPLGIGFGDCGDAADIAFEDLIAQAAPLEESPRSGDDLAGIFFTGGTTGLPKGVMLSHENLHAMSRNLALGLGIRQGCVNLHSAPMFHVSAVGIYFTTMLAGVHVFIPHLDAESILDAIETHRVTHCFTVPAIIDRMVKHPRSLTADVSTLQLLGYGGSAMPVAQIEAARARFPHVGLAHGYGMTEMPAMTALAQADHLLEAPQERLRSVGRALPEYELRVVDPAGNEVPRGVLGEIIGRGPNLMLGYWNRPQETTDALRSGWMHSQDIGWQDDAGYLYVEDRMKDMIVTGAENVYSIEVENVLYRSPQIAECAVIGVPDERWGERVHAVIIPKDAGTFDADELLRFCRQHIAGYKCPKTIEVRRDPLPRSAAGKVLKHELRAAYVKPTIDEA